VDDGLCWWWRTLWQLGEGRGAQDEDNIPTRFILPCCGQTITQTACIRSPIDIRSSGKLHEERLSPWSRSDRSAESAKHISPGQAH
jgi:hypothetical protein